MQFVLFGCISMSNETSSRHNQNSSNIFDRSALLQNFQTRWWGSHCGCGGKELLCYYIQGEAEVIKRALTVGSDLPFRNKTPRFHQRESNPNRRSSRPQIGLLWKWWVPLWLWGLVCRYELPLHMSWFFSKCLMSEAKELNATIFRSLLCHLKLFIDKSWDGQWMLFVLIHNSESWKKNQVWYKRSFPYINYPHQSHIMSFNYTPLDPIEEKRGRKSYDSSSTLRDLDDLDYFDIDLPKDGSDSRWTLRRAFRPLVHSNWLWLVHAVLLLCSSTFLIVAITIRSSTLKHVREFSAWCKLYFCTSWSLLMAFHSTCCKCSSI